MGEKELTVKEHLKNEANRFPKDWRIEINSGDARGSSIYYKGEKVGMITGLEFSLSATDLLPVITFSMYTTSVEVITKGAK
jgi:hypothetical protein